VPLLTIPLRAVPWGRVKRGAYGQGYIPKETREFQEAFRGYAQIQYRNEPLLTGRLKVNIVFSSTLTIVQVEEIGPGPGSRQDIDNLEKSVLDALDGVLYKDDSQVDILMARRS
jgi:Holliday junction resolvase RusA-like endonuclease